jgi:beta-N-acetylhexosaminidase
MGLPGTALGLTDRQLAGQRVVFAFPGASPPASLLARIRDGAAGAVILFGGNVSGVAGTRRLADDLQAVPRPADVDEPLLVMADQEGGRVRRLAVPPAAPAAALGALGAAAVGAQGRGAGRGLERAGVNVDLAPVADVARPGGLIARQGRAFGGAAAPVASRAAAFAAGLAGSGIAACAKHFPGLGAAAASTDDGPVSVDASLRELRRVDEAPFARLIRDGVPIVMVSTAVYPALDGLPAALSRRVIAGELRGRLGFRGVVVTDALDTPAVGPPDGVGTAAVRAARAGADLILVSSPAAGDRAADALAAGLSAGRLDRSAFLRSVDRVLALRARLAPPPVPLAPRR